MRKLEERKTKEVVGGGYHWLCKKTRYLGYNYGNDFNGCLKAAGRHTGKYGRSHATKVVWVEH